MVSLLSNHYHIVGYLRHGENLGSFMQRIHGSVAKLVNDLLPVRHVPFWRTRDHKDYFDGCLRDVLQAQRATRYTKLQAVRAGIVRDYRGYPHTRIYVDGLNREISLAADRKAYMEEVPYARYSNRRLRFEHEDAS